MRNKIIIFIPHILLALLSVYIYYKSQIVHDGNINNYYKPYFIFIIFFFIFCLCYIKLSYENKKNILLLSFSIFFSLYLVELYLILDQLDNKALKQFINQKLEYKKIYNAEYDNRSVAKIYLDEKEQNKDISKVIPPKEFYLEENMSVYPLSGKSNVETIYCNEIGYYSRYKSDRYGFNNPDIEWDKKKINFVFLGDSMVHGACVNEENTFTGNLRKKSIEGGIINLGQGGFGPLSILAVIREYIIKFQNIDNVIWIYYEGNDLSDLNFEMKSNTLRKYLQDEDYEQNLIAKQGIINEIIENRINQSFKKIEGKYFETKEEEINNNYSKKKRVLFSQYIKLYHIRQIIFKHKNEYINLKDFEVVTNNIVNSLKKNNVNLYFVYLENYGRYKKNPGICPNCRHKKDILNIVNKYNIKPIDTGNFFKNHENPMALIPYQTQGHFTEEGYIEISNFIYEMISNDKKYK